MRTWILNFSALTLLLTQAGCGLLIGSVKPVDEKSETYGVLDLSRENPDWVRLKETRKAEPAETTEAEISDVSFQSKKTASIISLNSACRPTYETSEQDLKAFTNQLLLGISDITLRAEKYLTVQKTPALETTLQGTLNGESMVLKTVVLRRGPCIYDLMYVARPQYFNENERDFAHFVASLRLK